MTVGLYGGSFNPPHSGHLHVAETALARFGLDRVWMLVSPQNPLKSARHTAPFHQRLAAVTDLVGRHPRIRASDLEARLGARYSVDTVRALTARHPGVHFVYVMGADSFAGLHHWRNWRALAARIPIGVVSRPGWTLRAQLSPAARALPRRAAGNLPGTRPPGWSYATAPFNTASSTALRAK